MAKQLDSSIMAMALVGYEAEIQRIEAAMAEIRSRLGNRSTRSAVRVGDGVPKARRTMSAAARKRIAYAQKKRWAAFHAKNQKTAPAKRKLSPERKAALVANLAKARAARAAKRAAV